MKQIILKSLTLHNFKGAKEITVDFNPDVTTISGRNAIGKSRLFTAFLWLLTGKDEQDRKDYEVKTRIDGEVLHHAECSVEAILSVDGEQLTLKRAIVENWVKPRGQQEQIYKGDVTECWWNGTPVKVGDYAARISKLIPLEVFKLVSNPSYFASLNWKIQREQLFRITDMVTDVEFAIQRPEFADLVDVLSNKSLEDFRKEVVAAKKKLKEKLDQIEPRIDQTLSMRPENQNWDVLEKALQAADKEIADIDTSMADITASLKKQNEITLKKHEQINSLKATAQKIIFDAEEQARQTAFAANARYNELSDEIIQLESNLRNKTYVAQTTDTFLINLMSNLTHKKTEQDTLRKEWFAENAKEYSGETVCPTCGQTLPTEKIEHAKEVFNQAKMQRLSEITETGKRLSLQITELEKQVADNQTQLDGLNSEIKQMEAAVVAKKKELEQMPEVKPVPVVPEELFEWIAIQKQIADLEATIPPATTDSSATMLLAQRKELTARRDSIKKNLATRDIIDRCFEEVEKLKETGKQLAQQLADLEKREFTITQFTQAKVTACEQRINSLFSTVSFKLFDYTLEGNLVETCVALIDGVPYYAANTAAKVNAGLDIINQLCRYYDIAAPIFIDNSESINTITPTSGQQIHLVVTNDEQLIIK